MVQRTTTVLLYIEALAALVIAAVVAVASSAMRMAESAAMLQLVLTTLEVRLNFQQRWLQKMMM
jgi:hypothetical protein